MATEQQQGYGTLMPSDSLGSHNPQAALVARALARVRTVLWAKVITVNAGVLNVPVTVQVQPLVSLTDSQGNAFPHGKISAIPATRLMAGDAAVILDPVVGDVGFLFVCDRDSTSVKANLDVSAPPTGRMFDLPDAIFWGGWGTTAPARYWKFGTDGSVSWKDGLGNSMQTGALLGVPFVNFVTTHLQVNGINVIVP